MRKARHERSFDTGVQELRDLIATMAKSLVDHPEDVVVEHAASERGGFVTFEVWCREEDGGALLGRRGANADSMRALMMAAGAARRIRVTLQILSSEGEYAPRR